VATGVLAALLASTHAQLDKTAKAESAAQSQLSSTRLQLARISQERAALTAVDSYVKLFFADDAVVLQDQARMENDCANSAQSQCASDLSSLQSDVQSFQDDRAHASVPHALQAADAQLRIALNDYITGFRALNLAQNHTDLIAAGSQLRAADAAFANAVSQLAVALGAQSSAV
jgi:hypothetical protein